MEYFISVPPDEFILKPARGIAIAANKNADHN